VGFIPARIAPGEMIVNPAKGFGGFYKRFSGGDKPRPY
jgi:hypothetical protein